MKEYEILNDAVKHRENTLVVTGSFFVAASSLLLGQTQVNQSVESDIPLVFASWAIYSIWLFFFQLTSARLTNISFARLRWLETQLDLNVHTFLFGTRDPFRRWVWLVLLDALLASGTMLLKIDVLPFVEFAISKLSSFILLSRVADKIEKNLT